MKYEIYFISYVIPLGGCCSTTDCIIGPPHVCPTLSEFHRVSINQDRTNSYYATCLRRNKQIDGSWDSTLKSNRSECLLQKANINSQCDIKSSGILFLTILDDSLEMTVVKH